MVSCFKRDPYFCIRLPRHYHYFYTLVKVKCAAVFSRPMLVSFRYCVTNHNVCVFVIENDGNSFSGDKWPFCYSAHFDDKLHRMYQNVMPNN